MNEIKDENDDIQIPMLKIQKRVKSFELTLFLNNYLKKSLINHKFHGFETICIFEITEINSTF
jgi:hypothetical protein